MNAKVMSWAVGLLSVPFVALAQSTGGLPALKEEVAAVDAKVAAEAGLRQTADAAIDGQIAAEVARAQAAEQQLRADIDNVAQSTGAAGPDRMRIAMRRWYDANLTSPQFFVGQGPSAFAFDGVHIWTAAYVAKVVTKIRASDGALVGSFPVPGFPQALTFDGANVWVAQHPNVLTKLRAGDGQVLATYEIGRENRALEFDGTHVWRAGYWGDVTKIRAQDGAVVATLQIEWGLNEAGGMAFDGQNVWIANYATGYITKIRASDATVAGSYRWGLAPRAILFDGESLWFTLGSPQAIVKFRPADGAQLAYYAMPSLSLQALAFDGTHIWVGAMNSVTKMRASDGAVVGTYPAGRYPVAMAFDGTSIWVADLDVSFVTKM